MDIVSDSGHVLKLWPPAYPPVEPVQWHACGVVDGNIPSLI